MLSNAGKYAIRAMLYLAIKAEQSKKTDIKRIAFDLKIPAAFLAKILQALSRNDLLKSTRGPNGGFILARDPHKIMLYDIIKITDGSDLFEKCLISVRICNEGNSPCLVHSKYQSIRKDLIRMFQELDLGTLASDSLTQEQVFSL